MSTNEESLTQVSEQSTKPDKELILFTLEPKQQRFVQLLMTGQFTHAQLAEMLQVHVNTISTWARKGVIKEAIAEAQVEVHDQVNAQLKALTIKATQRLHKLIDSPMDAIALQAVKDVLDRGGHKSKQEIKIDKTITTVEERLKTLIDSTLVEAEFTEVEE